MKKLCIITLICLLSAISAGAVENEFGGYWQTRAISMQDFNETNLEGTTSYVDTRTRLYYTAKFNEKFKFVNKFEVDTVWGDDDGGDIGADGKVASFEIKNSYADFFVGDHNFKVGIQPGKIARGFLFDDDFSGLTATAKIDSIYVPFMWMKVEENDIGLDMKNFDNEPDRDYFAVSPVFNPTETLALNPFLLYDKGRNTDALFLGLDVSSKLRDMTAWGTFILQAGEMDDQDCKAFLFGAGADAGLLHGQFFYASGDDDPNDGDQEEFGLHFPVGTGQGYYWAEIMGDGIFDDFRSNNAPGIKVSNVMAANIGATVKPMDKLTLTGDIWYAQLAEEVAGEDELGLEIDLKATYMIHDNLQLDVVAAYLMAGDATGDEDPIELGAQLSFSF